MNSEASKKAMNIELLEKVKSTLNSVPLTLPDGTKLSIDKFGGVSVYGPQKHPNSLSDTDDIFNCIKKLIEEEAKNRPLNFFPKDEDGQYYVPFKKDDIEDELVLPCVTFSVLEEEPGPWGRGNPGSPNTSQLKPVLRAEVADPDDANKTIMILSRRLSGKFKLTCWGENARSTDDLRKWLDHVIQMNMWYFTYSGLNQLHFEKRTADKVSKVDGKTMHSRGLEYYYMLERLQWLSVDNLREIIIKLNLVS
jgi:hypothetical protein